MPTKIKLQPLNFHQRGAPKIIPLTSVSHEGQQKLSKKYCFLKKKMMPRVASGGWPPKLERVHRWKKNLLQTVYFKEISISKSLK
jgi:hypothetical protein